MTEKFKVPYQCDVSGIKAERTQQTYNVLFADTCDNCGYTNQAFGKHIVSYYAFDKQGNEIEKLSLCLQCRFQWLRYLVSLPGTMVSMSNIGKVTIDFVGIQLASTSHLRVLRGGDVLQ